jgi:hypothetical protein
MNKVKSMLFISIILLIASSGYSAAPFTAPAVFDLGGSTIHLDASVNVPILGKVDVNVNPNPVTVQGQLNVDTIDTSGNWTGSAQGSGDTNISAPVVGSFPVHGEAGGSAQGVFDFANNTMTFSTSDGWAKVTIAGKDYDFDIAQGNITGTFDGKYIRFTTKNTKTFKLMGFDFTITYDINAVGELKAAESLDAFIDVNKQAYTSGDQFNTTIGFKRVGKQITVDAWVVLIDPSGTLLFFPGFTTTVANIPNLTLPANSELYDVPLFIQSLPGTTPPIQATGSYIIAIGFSKPGTTDFYTIASKQFTYNQ